MVVLFTSAGNAYKFIVVVFFPSLQEKEEQRVRKEILALANEVK